MCLQYGRPAFDPWVGKIPWSREWLPTPVFLPGEFHGQRCLVHYSPWSCKESGTIKQRMRKHIAEWKMGQLYMLVLLKHTWYLHHNPIHGWHSKRVCVCTRMVSWFQWADLMHGWLVWSEPLITDVILNWLTRLFSPDFSPCLSVFFHLKYYGQFEN